MYEEKNISQALPIVFAVLLLELGHNVYTEIMCITQNVHWLMIHKPQCGRMV